FDLRFAVARLALELDGAVHQRDPDLVRLAYAAGEFHVFAELVQQFALRAVAGQRLEFVLAVNVDDHRTDFAQQGERHRHAVQVAARAAVAGDHATDGELVFGIDGLFGEQLAQGRRRVADVEGGGELGALGAGADHVGT